MQSRRHGKDDRMISPQIILNHPVDFISKDDLPRNEAKLRNPYEMEDDKAQKGVCRLPFGKDFLSFAAFPGKSSLVMKSTG